MPARSTSTHWFPLLCSATSALLLAIGIDSPSTGADDAPAAAPPSAKEKEAGWKPLFDGKTLKNWEPTDFGGQGAVLVKDGLLIVEPGQPLTGVTWKGEELPKINYEVRLEAQKQEGSDFFLALTFPYRDSYCSLVLGGWGGGVSGISSINGFDASENESTDYLSFENNRWYKVRIEVTDKTIDAWLDGERIVNVETEGKRFSTRIEVDQNRPLGLCAFMTKAAYRNIEIRKLPADKTPPTPPNSK